VPPDNIFKSDGFPIPDFLDLIFQRAADSGLTLRSSIKVCCASQLKSEFRPETPSENRGKIVPNMQVFSLIFLTG
jgi:hypothetical protein